MVDDHVNVDDVPCWMLVGLADIVTVGDGGAAVTVTVTVCVAVPPGPVAVMVYVVVVAGETVLVPLTATLPMP